MREVAWWACVCLGVSLWGAPQVVWPTSDERYFMGEVELATILQPTASGILESALFGCVRSGGRQFHEGVDIRPRVRDRRGEAMDEVRAVMTGRVKLANGVAGKSNYGRYIVLEHDDLDVPVYTLYAHLADIADGIRPGAVVTVGSRIGKMGRSASTGIPKSRAHLHFEIGLRKSNRFDHWYAQQKFGSPNEFGNFNGMNLLATDPVAWLDTVRTGQFSNFRDYLRSRPTAFTLQVWSRRTPDIVQRYPALLTKPIPVEGAVAWIIDYTWYGLPKSWTPLQPSEVLPGREGDTAVLAVDTAAFEGRCRDMLEFQGATPTVGDNLRKDLQLMFGF